MRNIYWAALVLLVCAITGCSNQEALDNEDEIRLFVSSIASEVTDPQTGDSAFAGTATRPEDTSVFNAYMYRVQGVTMASGEATVKVEIVTNDLQEEVKGTYDWKLVLEGDKWKLLDAPLPE